MFSNNVSGSLVADIVKSLCILSAEHIGTVVAIFANIVIVPPAFDARVPIFHVSLLPFTVGCPTFGVEIDEFAMYVTLEGSVSVTTTPLAIPAH